MTNSKQQRTLKLAFLLLLALGCLPPAGADDMTLDPETTAGGLGHAGDVFLRMDNADNAVSSEEGEVFTNTQIFKFDNFNPNEHPVGWVPPAMGPADVFWAPEGETEGLSVDKFERVLTIKRIDSRDESSLVLNEGEYLEYNPSNTVDPWIRRTVNPSTRWDPADPDKIYIPPSVWILPCNGSLNTKGKGCGSKICAGPRSKPPGLANYSDIVRHQEGGSQVELGVVGFQRWFLGRGEWDLPAGATSANPPPRTAGEPYTDLMPRTWTAHRNQIGHTLIRAKRIRRESGRVQAIYSMLAEDECNGAAECPRPNGSGGNPLQGAGRSPSDTGLIREIGNYLPTNIINHTEYEMFASCGDQCLAANPTFSPEPIKSGLPTRILFGSEGRTPEEQKAYTLSSNGTIVEPRRQRVSGWDPPSNPGTWNEEPFFGYLIRVPAKEGDPKPSLGDVNSYGNAASLTSIEDTGDDFIYVSDALQDHFAVSSRFWRNGGTTFRYINEGSQGEIHWAEHTPSNVTAPDSGPTTDWRWGILNIGNFSYEDIAITADGRGVVYWLQRTLSPPKDIDLDALPGFDATEARNFLAPVGHGNFDPNQLSTGTMYEPDETPVYAKNRGSVPSAAQTEGYYLGHIDIAPQDNDHERGDYVRRVKMRQYPTYSLFAYNYIQDGDRRPYIDLTTSPERDLVRDRGSVVTGQFEYVYEARAPQQHMPAQLLPGFPRTLGPTAGSPSSAPPTIHGPLANSDAVQLRNDLRAAHGGETCTESDRVRTYINPDSNEYGFDEAVTNDCTYWEVEVTDYSPSISDTANDPASYAETNEDIPLDLVEYCTYDELPVGPGTQGGSPGGLTFDATMRENFLTYDEPYTVMPGGSNSGAVGIKCLYDNASTFGYDQDDLDDVFNLGNMNQFHQDWNESGSPSPVTLPEDSCFYDSVAGGWENGAVDPDLFDDLGMYTLYRCLVRPTQDDSYKQVVETQFFRTDTETYQEHYEIPRGPPTSYAWKDGHGAPTASGRSEDDFSLDLAAVNVTEPPEIPQPNTAADIYIARRPDGKIYEGDVPEIKLENPPDFTDGTATMPPFGRTNGNYTAVSAENQITAANGGADGDGVAGFFSSTLLEHDLQWRWRVVARSEPLRFLYHQGNLQNSPSPANDGVMHMTSWASFDADGPPALNLPADTPVFKDPGMYWVVLDMKGWRFSLPADVSFFSRPQDIGWLPLVGTYPSGDPTATAIDLRQGTDPYNPETMWPLPASQAFVNTATDPDYLEYTSGLAHLTAIGGSDFNGAANDAFARFVETIEVSPGAPTDGNAFVRNIAMPGSSVEVWEHTARDNMPDPSDTQYSHNDAASAQLTDVEATFEVQWYRAENYRYDSDLGGSGAPEWGDVGQTVSGPSDPLQTKYSGVGRYFRETFDAQFPGVRTAHGLADCNTRFVLDGAGSPYLTQKQATDAGFGVEFSLAGDGTLGSFDQFTPGGNGRYRHCQTHVGLAPTYFDWAEIDYEWYAKVDHPDGGIYPDASSPGHKIAEGNLGEVYRADVAGGAGHINGESGFFVGAESPARFQAIRDWSASGGDLLTPNGPSYPDNRTFQVILPLYGKDSDGNPIPLEFPIPTGFDGGTSNKYFYFTLKLSYPKMNWETRQRENPDTGLPEDDVYIVLRRQNGSSDLELLGSYNASTGGVFDPANPATFTPPSGSRWAKVEVLDRTPPSVMGGAPSPAPSGPSGGLLVAANSKVEFTVRDNNPYAFQDGPYLSEARMQIGTDPRNVGDATAWGSNTTSYGLGLDMGGGDFFFGFDLSFGGTTSFGAPERQFDFPSIDNHTAISNQNTGAPGWMAGHENSSIDGVKGLYSYSGQVYLVYESPGGENTAIRESPDPATYEFPTASVNLSSFILNSLGGETSTGAGILNFADNYYSERKWDIPGQYFPAPGFLPADGTEQYSLSALGMDDGMVRNSTATDSANLKGLGQFQATDSTPPNAIIELLDQRSGRAVYMSFQADFRQNYISGAGLPSDLSNPSQFQFTRVLVSGDEREAAQRIFGPTGDASNRNDNVEIGIVAHSGNVSGADTTDVFDFGDVAGAGPWRATNSTENVSYALEEDVIFRVRVIANDNSASPDRISIQVKSQDGSGVSSPIPDTGLNEVGTSNVVDGKAVLEVTHRYPLENETDVIEINIRDNHGQGRQILIPVRIHPHDTSIRIISDQTQRGTD